MEYESDPIVTLEVFQVTEANNSNSMEDVGAIIVKKILQ